MSIQSKITPEAFAPLVVTQQHLESAINSACDRLIVNDRQLFARNVNERSFSHKFAMYLQDEVEKWTEEWDVDCEFNRDAQDTGEDYAKRLDLIDKIESLTTSVFDEHARTVFPDVIVHQRGPGNNLLVVEVKKGIADPISIEFDRRHKLPAYVKQLGYQAAAFLLLRMDDRDCQVEWIRKLG
ncbi:MAG TPA: hypothetical protein VND64_30830 [Pirellulales bacterium]|nr:hypothetical protein [Pirellulales bacterium]